MPRALVVTHLLIQFIVVEQHIQTLEYWIDPSDHLGHAGKDILGRITVDQHEATSLHLSRLLLLFYHISRLSFIPSLFFLS
jgi:hypothetical protein